MFRSLRSILGRAFRETGQQIDRLGLSLLDHEIFRESWARHRQIMSIAGKLPDLPSDCFIAPNATVIGDVDVFDCASIWYGAVVRGDRNRIKIGAFTNVQDRSVIITVDMLESGIPATTEIGDHVTIGHGAVLTSCKIGNLCLIGMNAVIMEGVQIDDECLIAAGSVVPPGTRIPSRQMWAGNPAKFVRDTHDLEIHDFRKTTEHYHKLALTHRDEFLDYGTQYQDYEKLIESMYGKQVEYDSLGNFIRKGPRDRANHDFMFGKKRYNDLKTTHEDALKLKAKGEQELIKGPPKQDSIS